MRITIIAIFCSYSMLVWGQVSVPNGTVTPTTNPTTQNVGVNENTPKATLDVFRPKHGLSIEKPVLKLRTSGYYLPPGNYLQDDPSNCPPQSNIIEVDKEYNQLACVISPPNPTTPFATKRLLTFTNDGFLGINMSNPRTLLHLNRDGNNNDILSLSYLSGSENWNYLNIGHSYLAFNSRQTNSVWEVDDGSYMANTFRINHGWGGLDFDFYNHSSNQQGASTQTWTPFNGNWKNAMRIHWNGNIRMGEKTITTGVHTNYKLSVDGKIVTKEVVVTNGPEWADYVFDEDYILMPLSELKEFIVANGHLPKIPTTEEIKNEGINVSEILTKQMEKIEELTLYLIEQQARIEELSNELEKLKNEINEK